MKKNLPVTPIREIAIYGAGGFGRETSLLIDQINRVEKEWRLIGFFDDGLRKGEMVEGLPVLGGIKEVNEINKSLSVVLAIADPEKRMNIASSVHNDLVEFPVIAHPQALIGSEANWLGRGCIITAGCILTTGVVLGEFSIINLATTVGHDVKIGSFCSIMPGCSISGNVTIGEATYIGTGAKILQNLSIGNRCVVGAGAVVIKNFGDSITIVGIPATGIK